MPIDPDKDTFIELERGELVKVEKDTDHLWKKNPNPLNPVANLTLEGGGRCFYYHREDGIWYCSEYVGSLRRVPEFQKRYKASQLEATEREAKRLNWERENGVAMEGVNSTNAGTSGYARGSGRPEMESSRMHHGMSMPYTGANTATPGYEPEYIRMGSPAYFPTASPSPDTRNPQFPGQRNHFAPMNPPQTSTHPPDFPFGSEAHPQPPPPPPPLPSSFPPNFPFEHEQPAMPPLPPMNFPWGPSPPSPQPPPFSGPPPFPSHLPYTHSSIPPAGFPGGRRVFNGGEYVRVQGRVVNHAVDNSASMGGRGVEHNWNSDFRQEQDGVYHANWGI